MLNHDHRDKGAVCGRYAEAMTIADKGAV